MKADKFTKVILTVIAVNLTILTVKNLDIIPKTYAGAPTTHPELSPKMNYGLVPLDKDGAVLVKFDDMIDVNIKKIGTYDKLGVTIKKISTSDKLGVNIKEISTSDKLDVNIDKIGGGFVQHGGPIAVKIK